jgi:hypothetical protein
MNAIWYIAVAALITSYATAQPLPPSPSPQTLHPNSIAAQLPKPWRHVTGSVSDKKFDQDKAKCARAGHMAPVGAGKRKINFIVGFIECIKAEGYVPDDNSGAPSNRRLEQVR